MVEVVGTKLLSEMRDQQSSTPFREDALADIKAAVKAVDEEVFVEPETRDGIDFDEELLARLDGYVSGERTEYQLWGESNHSVDLYDPERKIAIEVEKTKEKNVWKDFVKFAVGADEEAEYGCVIVPENYTYGDKPYVDNIYQHAVRSLEFMTPIVPTDDIAVIGYHDPRQ